MPSIYGRTFSRRAGAARFSRIDWRRLPCGAGSVKSWPAIGRGTSSRRGSRGFYPTYNVFLRPSAVTSRPDGGFYVASFASNDVLLLDANGRVLRKIRAGFSGFDHPFDVLAPGNGLLYVSEYGSDHIVRCTPTGGQVVRFGRKGLGDGQLLGPQYLASDGKGYIYVTDTGNARVSKYDYDGKFVLSFGQKSDLFPGLANPSGIAIYNDDVYVADATLKSIAVFDLSGNYVSTIAAGSLNGPEGLSLFDDSGDLLIADTTRVVLYNVDNAVTTVLADLTGTAQNIVKVVPDSNGDLLAADFDSSTVFVLSQYSAMYAGLSVQIDRVYSDKFPSVTADVSVKTRLGAPFTGLDAPNFVLTEGGVPVGNPKLVFKGMDGDAQIVILIDRSNAMLAHKQDIVNSVLDIVTAVQGKGSFKIVTAGENPVVEVGPNTERNTAAKEAAENGTYSDAWRFDLGLRMATSELIPKQGKSAVVFITQGDLGANPFQQYAMNDLLQFMENNGVRLYTVFVDQRARVSEPLRFMTRESGGKSYYLYQPEGIGGIVNDLREARDATYVFTYTSPSQANFGNSFIPLEVETHLFARSGRDEAGYYAPLQF